MQATNQPKKEKRTERVDIRASKTVKVLLKKIKALTGKSAADLLEEKVLTYAELQDW